jgi:diguanylate cyclase (GGDEF)-like protein
MRLIAYTLALWLVVKNVKEMVEEVHQLAFYDSLTGLANRSLLIDRLQIALLTSSRKQQFGAILFIDIDKFKMINDTLGHGLGDMLLKEVANRLKRSVRKVDTVARIGGDEFAIFVENLGQSEEDALRNISRVSEKILTTLAQEYNLGSQDYLSSASIGVNLFYGNDKSVDELINHADMAMYKAKSLGRNRVRFFDIQLQKSVENRAAIETDVRLAIANNQLKLYYQIQMNSDNRPIGAEALIRWIHPERGLIPPSDFIPIAEESALICDLGVWVLNAACKQLAIWKLHEKTSDLILAVNISAVQFKEPDFVEMVKLQIDKHHVNPLNLKLELTESVALESLDLVVAKMSRLKEIGISLSLDDFGTGYSSLSYLKQLPFDQIKIDQQFIANIATDSSDAVMIKTIIGLANNFKMSVIAEGVETDQQLAFLKQYGCNLYQGYFFSKPIPVKEFEALIGCNYS